MRQTSIVQIDEAKEWNHLPWNLPADVTVGVEAIDEATDVENTTVVITITTSVQATVISSTAATHRYIPRRLMILVVEVVDMVMVTGLLDVCIGVVADVVGAASIARATNAHAHIVEFR